ncbi:MAG: hypothetical protein R3D26_20035 [Cyanobacteriota/Melainabacteria group bacterium]
MSISGLEFLAYLFSLLVFELAARTWIFKNLNHVEASSSSSTSSLAKKEELRPAEIAYLIRGGDTTHALIVLAADLMQRALKRGDDMSFLNQLTDYEKNMWTVTKKALSDWAQQKAKKTILGNARNPIQIAKRLSFLYRFITGSLSTMIRESINDPKRLRKYFSAQGLWRIIADFTSAGYRQAFENEIRETLLKRGLLVEAERRKKYASLLFTASILGFAGVFLVAAISFKTWYLALVLGSGSLFAAALFRIVLIARQLLPFYEELAVVANQIERTSRRLSLIKFLLRFINTLNWLVAILLGGIISALVLTLAKLLYFEGGSDLILGYLGLFTANFACVDLLFKALDLSFNDQPSKIALDEIKILKEDLKEIKPLNSFKEYLDSQVYNPKFSRLIAVYGIETLFILA